MAEQNADYATTGGVSGVGLLANVSVIVPVSRSVLTITKDGRTMRGDRDIKDLSREELLVVIGELIDLMLH